MGSMRDKISGKSKQVIGKVTKDKELQARGKMQETAGELKAKFKGMGEDVSNKVDDAIDYQP